MKKLIMLLVVILFLFANAFAIDNHTLITYQDIKEAMVLPVAEEDDIVKEAKEMITQYYGKNTFEEPEWIRVKNFLTWMEDNKAVLNQSFKDRRLDLSTQNKEPYIGAFLGANYVANKMINKFFNLPIYINARESETSERGAIRISVTEFIAGVNSGMHEAAHLLPFLNRNRDVMYPEEIAIFSNLKYGLPRKVGIDVREGTRAYFISADDEFVGRYYKDILNEYSEIVFSVTKFSKYTSNNLSDYAIDYANPIRWTLEALVIDKVMDNFNLEKEDLEYFNAIYLDNIIFKDSVRDIFEKITPKLNEANSKGKDLYYYTQDLINKDNQQKEIAKIFVKNLKKYADENIPPIPKEYI